MGSPLQALSPKMANTFIHIIITLLALTQIFITSASALLTIPSATTEAATNHKVSPTTNTTTTTATTNFTTSNQINHRTTTVFQLTQCERSKVNITCPNNQVIDIIMAFYARQNQSAVLDQCRNQQIAKGADYCDEQLTNNKIRRFLLFKCQFQQQCEFKVAQKTFDIGMSECVTKIRVAEIVYRCLNKTTPFVKTKMDYVVRENINLTPPYVPPFELIIVGDKNLNESLVYETRPIQNIISFLAPFTTPKPIFTQQQQPVTTTRPPDQPPETTTNSYLAEETTSAYNVMDDLDDDEPPSNAVDDYNTSSTSSTTTTLQDDYDDKPDKTIKKMLEHTYSEYIADKHSTPAYEQQEIYSFSQPTATPRLSPSSSRPTSRHQLRPVITDNHIQPIVRAASAPTILSVRSSESNQNPSTLVSFSKVFNNDNIALMTLFTIMTAAFVALILTILKVYQRQKKLNNTTRGNNHLSDSTTIISSHHPLAPPPPNIHTPYDNSMSIKDYDYSNSFPNPPQLTSEKYFKENISSFLGTSSPCSHDVVDGPIYHHSHTMVKYANMRDAYMV